MAQRAAPWRLGKDPGSAEKEQLAALYYAFFLAPTISRRKYSVQGQWSVHQPRPAVSNPDFSWKRTKWPAVPLSLDADRPLRKSLFVFLH